MTHQRVLDLGRVGVEAPDDEHVLDAADDAQSPGRVDDPQVARAQPPLGRQHLGRLGGIVEVAGHHAAAAQQHLARLARRDVVPARPTTRSSNPGRGLPTVVATASGSSPGSVAQAVPPSVSP